jgi:hypothetical protein
MPGTRSDVSETSSEETSKPGKIGTDHRTSKTVNLLSAKNGGAMVMASGQSWQALMLGKDKQYTVHAKDHVVFAFRQHQAATIDTIAVQFPRNDKSNLKDFDVAISNQSAKGPYESVGTFYAKNDTSSQQFALRPVTAKYLKLIFLSPQDNGHQILVYNFKAFGSLEKPATK